MTSFERLQEILHSPFDLKTHKENIENYLEVCIDRQGTIHYAVPSHQEWLIQRACNELGRTREEIIDSCPPEHYLDYMEWLMSLTGSICVWNHCISGNPNAEQKKILYQLQTAGLYCPCGSCE